MSFSIFGSRSASTDIPLLPLYASPLSPQNPQASMQQTFESSKLVSTMTSPQPESLRIFTRQDAHLQTHLQELLDAQSEGLLAGLGANSQDTASSTGSRTPTASELGTRSSSKPRSVIPVRQPQPKKIGLRSARRGISKTIRQLSQIKDEEARVLQDEINHRDGSLSTIESLSSKEQGLREAISGIQAESPTARIAELKGAEKELGNEIHELETRLFEMKARQRHLLREIQATGNGVQSKLSSYKNALQLAEKEARSFLARPPLQDGASQKRGVWALPQQRRTLEMAREQFQEEQNRFGKQIEGFMGEKQALDEGGSVWDDVVRQVAELETMLQGEMQNLNSSTQGNWAESGMRRILERMRDAQRHVEELLRVAEEKDWKLLVCCIGAELEALVEGQSVLGEALEASGVSLDNASESQKADVFIDEPSPSITGVNGRIPDEDDGPGPDLLISQDV